MPSSGSSSLRSTSRAEANVDPLRPRRPAGPIALITLGCPKNQVDSENMLGGLSRAGFEITSRPEDAVLVVVNTCAFLTDAQRESIETILELAALKRRGKLRSLIVAGCLPQRHGEEVLAELSEVDYLLGPGTLQELPQVARGLLEGSIGRGARLGGLDRLEPDWGPRVLSGLSHSAYLKISEGCSHACTFCIIPQLRGKHRSRPREEIRSEAERLVAAGVRELVLVAQDTTSYGLDLYGELSLDRLLEDLDRVEGLRWIRLLYTYPSHWTDPLIRGFQRLRRLVPYADIPVQHASDPILRRMRRGFDWARTERLLRRLRDEIPGMILRTTVITGFPGESEDDHERLLEATRDFEFDHLGAFPYSTEEGTPAAELPDPVPDEVRALRCDAVLAQQREIALKRNRARIGQDLEVLIDRVEAEAGLARGRWAGQAPEIDGEVLVPIPAPGPGIETLRAGSYFRVRIRGAGPYDLVASLKEDHLC